MSTKTFYDKIAPFYHLIYADWGQGVANQAKALDSIIRSKQPTAHDILDVACGIGTQALGLAQLGYRVQGSDLSTASIRRARHEAKQRALKLPFSVADMTSLSRWHGPNFDVVMACDNAVPHLLTDRDILKAFKEARKCLRSNGLYMISVRDYDKEHRAGTQFKPYGIRKTKDATWALFQTWAFKGNRYEVALYAIEQREGKAPKMRVARSTYYAVRIRRLMALMKQAGFTKVKRVDGAFYQPVILGMNSE